MLPPIITFKPKAVRRRILVRRSVTAAPQSHKEAQPGGTGVRGQRIALKASSLLGQPRLHVLKQPGESTPC